jgi:hypothetical protein
MEKHKYSNQVSLSPRRDLNPGIFKHESGVLSTLPRRSVSMLKYETQ